MFYDKDVESHTCAPILTLSITITFPSCPKIYKRPINKTVFYHTDVTIRIFPLVIFYHDIVIAELFPHGIRCSGGTYGTCGDQRSAWYFWYACLRCCVFLEISLSLHDW
jgi:hypothetical protein